MPPRPVIALALLGLAGAGAAAVGAQSPYTLPETPVTNAALRLPAASKCVKNPYTVTLRVVLPSGAAFREVTVQVDGKQAVSVTGATISARHVIYIGRGRSTVRVDAVTLGGKEATLSRTYRSCAAKKKKKKAKRRKAPTQKPTTNTPPRPKPIPVANPISEGGGED